MAMIQDFKKFVMRGNVVDMAVGIIIGGAFGKIVGSLVTDIIMPPIGLLLSGVDFSKLAVILKEAAGETAPVSINYGIFINTMINFVIIAFSIFLMISLLNRMKKKEEVKAAPPAPSKEEVLLTEIRDILKAKE